MVDAVIVRAGDSVATLLRDAEVGDRKDTWQAVLTLSQAVTRGHEIARDAIARQRILWNTAIRSVRETAAERNGEREIAIWKRGVTL